MDPYIVFQLFAWAVWLVCVVVITVDWWKDKSQSFCIGEWIGGMIGSFVVFTIPLVNAFALFMVFMAASGELFRWIDRKIARMRNSESENSQQQT